MRDLALLLILSGLVGAAFLRPWLGVLGLAVLGYMHPQGYGWEFMPSFPAFRVMFLALVLSMAYAAYRGHGDLQWPPLDWRLLTLLILWVFFFYTTTQAKAQHVAWPKFYEVSRIFLTLVPTLLLIDSREKLRWLIACIALSFGLVTLKGGYWALMSGFSDRVYGPPHSQYYGNNELAVAAAMNIPLLVLWLRGTHDRGLRGLLMLGIALSVAAALSSWSRGGLLSLSVTLLLLGWFSTRRWLALPLLGAVVWFAFGNLPDQWFARMETIAGYRLEDSALSRLDTWRTGIEYAWRHPFSGAGFEGWRFVNLNVASGRRDWHSAYVEIMTEHGLIAFALWCSLLLGSIGGLALLGRRSRGRPTLAWVRDYRQMLTTSLVAYAVGAAFLGLSYWDLLYQLVAICVLVIHLARRETGQATSTIPP